jgi:hypothetical protein
MTVTQRRGPARRARLAAWALPLAVLALAAVAAPAGALSPAPPAPQLTVTPSGGNPIVLWRYPECRDFVLPPMPDVPQTPAAVAAKCVSPIALAPTATFATPAELELRSDRPLTEVTAGIESDDPFAGVYESPVVAQRDPSQWTMRVPAMGTGAALRVSAVSAEGFAASWYLKVERPAPLVEEASVTVLRAARRAKAVTVVVKATPGLLSTYLTVAGRRRSGVVRTTVTRGGTVRVQIPIGRLTLRALARAGGVTAVLRPSGAGQPATRAGLAWRP